MGIRSWPDYLRAAGVEVAEHNNWRTNTPLGELPARPYLVWHHDASPPGASPGALDWIIGAYNSKDASAQICVSYDGVWHFIGSGVAWHTGDVLPGMPSNFNAVGVETDETIGETWSPALLASLRRGTAAIAAAEGYDPATWLHFHKTICSPVGRKSDPSGLDLASERATVRALMSGKNPNPPQPSKPAPDVPVGGGGADPEPEDDDMAMQVRRDNRTLVDYAYNDRTFIQIKDPTHFELLRVAGFVRETHGAAALVNTWDLEWIRGQVEAWGGHVDPIIQPGK